MIKKCFRKHLFTHQHINIQEMERLEHTNCIREGDIIRNTQLGILYNPPGYGKNVTMVGLLTRDVMKFDLKEPYTEKTTTIFSSGLTTKCVISKFDKLPVNLLVATVTSIEGWKIEFEYTDMKILYIDKMSILDDNYDKITNYDVVVVTPNIYNHLIITYNNKAWKRVIFDEPNYLNIPNMKWVKACFYWFISSCSPREIAFTYQHFRKHFMKSVFGDINEDIEDKFKGNIITNNIETLNSSCTLPKVKHYYHKINYPERDLTLLNGKNIEYKVRNVSGSIEEDIIHLIRECEIKDLSEIEKKLNCDDGIDENERSELIKQKLKLDEQVKQTRIRIHSSINDICTICNNELNEPVFEIHCQNFFCSKCILQWLKTKQTCPICRDTINNNDIILYRKNKPDTNTNEDNDTIVKKVTCIIKTNQMKKTIVFSTKDEIDRELYDEFNKQSITYYILKGSDKKRVDIVNKFLNSDNTNVLFVHSISDIACMEINTTNIIICHDITLQSQDYLISRICRINKKDVIYVHHMTTEI